MKIFKYNSSDHQRRNNYFWLLIFFLLLLFFPVLSILFHDLTDLIFRLIASLIILWGSYVVTNTERALFIGSLLAFLAILGFWCDGVFLEQTRAISFIRILLGTVYFGYLGFHLATQLLMNNKHLTINLVYGSIIIYFILGILGGQLCAMMDIMSPGTFFDAVDIPHDYDYYYFSFITLMTIGYGDIAPQTEAGKALALLIGLSGQVYLTIIMAIIIGKYLKHTDDNY